MGVDPKELDQLLEKAGVGARTAKKLRDANGGAAQGGAETGTTRRGHGAATPPTPRSFGSL